MDFFGGFSSPNPFQPSFVYNTGGFDAASDFGVKYGTNLANNPNYGLSPTSGVTPLAPWNPAPSIFAPPIYDTPQQPFTHTPSPWINSAPPGRAPDASPYDGHSSLPPAGIDYSQPSPPGAPFPLASLDYGYTPATNPFAMYDMMGMG